MAQEKLKAIDIDVGKGGVHLVDANELLLKEFPDYTFEKKDDSRFGGYVNDKRPLKYIYTSCFTPTYFGVDFGKAPDYAGRVIYWVAPFKYKTAGFDHQMVHSDFGFVWRFINHDIISLHDLPIKYNFEMADRYYEKYLDNIIREFDRLLLNKTLDDLFNEFVSHFDIPKEYLLPQHNENKLNKLFITTRRKLK